MMAMAPGPFFYYNPDPSPDHRQHGQFSQQPTLQQMHMFPVVPTLPSTPIYSRPSSSCSQPPMQAKMISSVPSNMTPVPSPQLGSRKPTMMLQNPAKLMLETDLYDNDHGYYPATPPLSSSGSNIGSPGSIDILSTPLNPMFSGLDGYESLKVDDAIPDGLEGLDWSSCGSPPMTPGTSTATHIITTSRTSPSRPLVELGGRCGCPVDHCWLVHPLARAMGEYNPARLAF